MSKIIPIISILFSLIYINCSKEDKQIVARVGEENISFSELEMSFILEPQYVKRTPLRQARRNQLDYLVRNKYYYLAADYMDMQKQALMEQRITYIKNKEILTALINDKYLKSVKMDKDDLREGLHRSSEKRHVQNYFTADAAEARKFYEDLKSGAINKDAFFEDDAVDLGYISYGDVDLVVEDAVYALDTGTYSPLIKTSQGYHIVHVSDIVQNEDFVNLNNRLRLQNTAEVIRKRKADVQIKAYLDQAADGAKIQINNRMVDALLTLVQQFDEGVNQNPTMMAPPVSNRELINITLRLKDIEDKPLVRFKDEEITVAAFVERLKEMPPFHRPHIKGRNFILRSILDMVRNDLLLLQAIEEGYGDKDMVKEKYEAELKEFLAREFGIWFDSVTFREENPSEWAKYSQAYLAVKTENDVVIDEDNLFSDVANPDSIMTNAPVPVFLKNKYIW